MNHSASEFYRELLKRNRFLITSHVKPEGDAVGSVLAMDSFLKRLGKKTRIVCEDSFPKKFEFLRQNGWTRFSDFNGKGKREKFDALLAVDCPDISRIGVVQKLITSRMTVFNIDHHVTNRGFGHFNYVKADASACGEVIYDLLIESDMTVNRGEAQALYVAIATDTGSFRYCNTTENSHYVSSRLIQAGINIEQINEHLYATTSLKQLKFLAFLIGKIRVMSGGSLAWVEISRDDLKKNRLTYRDTEGFIDFLKNLKDVKCAILFSEAKNVKGALVNVSFRSKHGCDVSKIAGEFGGGGHRKAAGCTLRGSLPFVRNKILERMKDESKIRCGCG
ncbi:MAG: hypothetical protein A3G33_07360 [Omnitrophica bacterium RIFCSPLOWO2_12_FULL_44_17]|uniref:DDH domain-containing protein n=1 Tax=Candidatus Danuiimicrobium aquiferis TaxID=1801832 RepID=A0A1G1KYU6_9BACT|nr:MAG: hypothetical protein A3B72_07660 [Omnitrophica bacterium RIFCSPHIGHO2_02_FULL_45_28]OGW89242.1 MAG: hypothetical protein A3E74_08335 [Omnitrophica bacterium RIFCSPHIGHO2_12_FULL_44_12]OGW98041.1 MAG: hypothetical protein A3G33_07360 [Omnitrophica bacterium RIFCSPLOWO2_12_FULL_44_17]OGX03515.1 MAG: hypothetical protein A3J12_02870 [Omnitrophica bacterium RIFCSPLOWO2_02_FULL_44_11]